MPRQPSDLLVTVAAVTAVVVITIVLLTALPWITNAFEQSGQDDQGHGVVAAAGWATRPG